MARAKKKKQQKKKTRSSTKSRAKKVNPVAANERVKFDPLYAKTIDMAQRHLDDGEFEEALTTAMPLVNDETAEKDRRAFLFASRIAGFAAAQRGDFDLAKECALKALAIDEDQLDAYYLLVYIYTRLEDFTLVNIYGQKYLELHSRIKKTDKDKQAFTGTYAKAHEVLNNMGAALREEGRMQEAVNYFENAIKMEPRYPIAYINLARLLNSNSQHEEAMSLLSTGIRKCPDVEELRMLRDSMKSRSGSVSFCMIVKDEEERLSTALESIKSFADEIIVVDTGSTDRTVEIAESYGAKVYYHEWEKDFSKARNQSISYATKEWVGILDADEEIVQNDLPILRQLLDQKDHNLVSCSVINVSEDGSYQSFLPSIRFFRRSISARYDGIVHNQLKFDTERETVLRGPVRFMHYGYGLTPEQMKRKIQRSRELLLQQLKENPNNAFANMNLAQIYRGETPNPSPEQAKKIEFHAQRAVDNSNPNDKDTRHIHLMALHQLASGYYFQNRLDDAQRVCKKAIEYKPDYLDPIITLGHISSVQKRWHEAVEWYERYLDAREKFKDSEETEAIILLSFKSQQNAYYNLAMALENLNRFDDALENYRKVAECGEGFLETHLRIAQICFNKNEYEAAIREAEIEIDYHPKAWPAHYILGEAYRMTGNATRSEDHLLQADRAQPGNQDIMKALATLYFQIERIEDAKNIADRLIREYPDFDVAARLIGDICFAANDFQNAASQYEKLMVKGMADEDVFNNLGNSYFKLGRYEEAESAYRNALSYFPDSALVHRNLGLTLAKAGKVNEAADMLSSYLEFAPDDFQVAHLLGDIMFEKGQLDAALKMYELCMSLKPNSHVILTKVADVYYRLGHYESAKVGYRKALEIEPGYTPAKENLEMLEEAMAGGGNT